MDDIHDTFEIRVYDYFKLQHAMLHINNKGN